MENILNAKDLNQKLDYTVSDRFITYGEIKKILDKAVEQNYRCVCVPPSFVRWSKKYVGGNIKICELVNYPLGNATINTKTIEIKEGLRNGADEFEVIINHNELKSGNVDYVLSELKQLKHVARNKLFKAVFEPSVLTKNETETFLKCALSSRVDYVVIGTPFGVKTDITEIDVIKLRLQKKIKIKYFLMIREDEYFEPFLNHGIDRIGVTAFRQT